MADSSEMELLFRARGEAAAKAMDFSSLGTSGGAGLLSVGRGW